MPNPNRRVGLTAVALSWLVNGCSGGASGPPTSPQATASTRTDAPTPTATQTPTPAPSPSAAHAVSILAEYPLPATGAPAPHPAFAGDGNLWYAPLTGMTIYSMSTSGVITPHPSAYAGTGGSIADLVAGPDGSLYYVVSSGSSGTPNQIRHMTTGGSDALVAAPPHTAVTTIAFNAGGTEIDGSSYAAPNGSIVEIKTSGNVVDVAALPNSGLAPTAIAVGKDKRTWILLRSASGTTQIAATSGHGHFTTYPLDPPAGLPSLALGPYGSLYYPGTDAGSLARVDVKGAITKFAYAATGPIVDIERDGDAAVAFIGAPTEGEATSTIGVFRVGSTLATSSFPNVADAIAPGPDGNLYVFEHRAVAPTAEFVAKIAPPT